MEKLIIGLKVIKKQLREHPLLRDWLAVVEEFNLHSCKNRTAYKESKIKYTHAPQDMHIRPSLMFYLLSSLEGHVLNLM